MIVPSFLFLDVLQFNLHSFSDSFCTWSNIGTFWNGM